MKIVRHIVSNGREYSKEIDAWFNECKENRNIYQDLLAVWQLTGELPPSFSPNRAKAWERVRSTIKVSQRRMNIYRLASQVAAAVIIIFVSIWIGAKVDSWRPLEFTEITSPPGQKTQILLPDSSTVWLNGGSKIKYAQNFNQANRNVELVGEGYFDVRKNFSSQFVVKVNAIDVKVFGTQFNVKAYDDGKKVEVGLKTGSIGIESDGRTLIKLNPGDFLTYDKESKEIELEKKAVDLVLAWTKNELVFEEQTIKEVFDYFEHWYGVHFSVDQEVLDGELLTFKIKTESLNEALSLLKLLKPMEYQINGERVTVIKPN